MVYFQTKKPNLGKFWRALEWNMLVFFVHLKYIKGICIFYAKVVVIWYIFPILVNCVKKNLATLQCWSQSYGHTQGSKNLQRN
jgi:hypothetical protein